MRSLLRSKRLSICIATVTAALISVGSGTQAFASAQSSSAAPYSATLQQSINQQLRDHPGGTQVSSNEVAYDGGKVIVVFPDATGYVPTSETARPEIATSNTEVQPDADYTWNGCPYGNVTAWYCFYQNQNFAGRMLQFQDCSGSGLDQSFSTYGFADETSSWVNTTGIEPLSTPVSVGVWQGGTYLWGEEPDSDSSYVGSANNDKAEWFESYCLG